MAEITHEQPAQKKKGKATLIALIMVFCLAIAGVAAYLTDTESIINRLSINTDLNIELTEPNWDKAHEDDPDYAKDLVPTETVTKDPTVTNKGSLPAYVAVKLTVPVFSGHLYDPATQTISEVTDSDLFGYDLQTGWTLQGEPTVENGFKTYTYLFDNLMNKDDQAVLFTQVTVANLIENIDIDATQITVDAFGIQAEGFDSAAAAYAGYLKQNGLDSGDTPETPDPEQPSEPQPKTLSAAKVNAAIPDSTTKVIFSSVAPTSEQMASGADVSELADQSYYVTTSGTTATISSAEGGNVVMPSNSSAMLADKASLKTVDFTGADASAMQNASYMLRNTAVNNITTGENWNTGSVTNAKLFNRAIMQNTSTGTNVGLNEVLPTGAASYICASTPALAEDGKCYMLCATPYKLIGTDKMKTVEKVIFTDIEAPEGVSKTDISYKNDKSVVGWIEGNTLYISSQKSGQRIKPYYFASGGTVSSTINNAFNFGSTTVKSMDVSNLDITDYTKLDSMFSLCNCTEITGLSNLDTSNATSMAWMGFKVANLDLSAWDVSNVVDMTQMFGSSLQTLNIAGWNTPNLKRTGQMFDKCMNLTSIRGIESLETSSLVHATAMFRDCRNLESLDLSNWNTKSLAYTESMFDGCSNLTTIFAGDGWNSSSILATNSKYMFNECNKLKGGNGTTFDRYYSDAAYARIDTPETPGYFTYKAA